MTPFQSATVIDRKRFKSLRYTVFAAATILAPAAAQCQQVGYAWYNLETTANTQASFNSAGGAISFQQVSTGVTQVTFAGLGNSLNSNVEVTGAETRGYHCSAENWGSPNGTDVQVTVTCFNAAGAPVSALFNVLYQARTSWAGPGKLAFVWADEPTTASYTPPSAYQFNSSGGANTITRTGTGTYTVTLPKLAGRRGTVLATAYGATPAQCQVASWAPSGTAEAVNIACYSNGGQPADQEFTMSYSEGTTAGVSPTSPAGAYASANKPKSTTLYTPPLAFQFNTASSGPLTAQRGVRSPGSYTVFLPSGDAYASSLPLATAYNAPGIICDIGAWSETIIDVFCFNQAGKPANADFTLTFLTAP